MSYVTSLARNRGAHEVGRNTVKGTVAHQFEFYKSGMVGKRLSRTRFSDGATT